MQYFPFTGEAYVPKMGLKPLEWANWLEFGRDEAAQLALKKKLFAEHRSQVLHLLQGTDALCFELRERLENHRREFYPQKFMPSEPPKSGADAMEQISRFTQEDWCLLSQKDQEPYKLVVGSVCFPSRWNLLEKMGKDADGIHEPVPDYSKFLAAPAKNFLDKLSVDRPMWRLNWTIHDSDQLFCPGPVPSRTDLREENILSHTVLRVERQTLCRLPKTGAIAFSIRTHITPMGELAADPERKKLMLASLEGLPEETAIYRGMGPFWGVLKKALGGV